MSEGDSSGRGKGRWAWALALVAMAAVWAALALGGPAQQEVAQPTLGASPWPSATATVVASPQATPQPVAAAPTQAPASPQMPTLTDSPAPDLTTTLYVVADVQIARREATPTPAAALGVPAPLPEAIGRIEIPALNINQPIVPVSWRIRVVDGQPVAMWDTVKGAVAHHRGSAGLGQPGNTVLTGHTRGDGKGEFQNLWELQPGQEVRLYDLQGALYLYAVESVVTLQELGQTVEQRQQNALYLQPTGDTRLTLITCWPEWVYTHRVIVIAKPKRTAG